MEYTLMRTTGKETQLREYGVEKYLIHDIHELFILFILYFILLPV